MVNACWKQLKQQRSIDDARNYCGLYKKCMYCWEKLIRKKSSEWGQHLKKLKRYRLVSNCLAFGSATKMLSGLNVWNAFIEEVWNELRILYYMSVLLQSIASLIWPVGRDWNQTGSFNFKKIKVMCRNVWIFYCSAKF